ncbi:MAG: glutamine amidotransferase [Rhodanobacteraceae bacterium]
MKSLLLIQTGEAPESIHARLGGFADWFRTAMRLEPAQMHVVRVDAGETLPRPEQVAGAVITGSAAMVTERHDWSERTAGWIRRAMDARTPMFGVCYGHQLMAYALGGTVGWLPAGREIGTQPITRTDGAIDGWMRGVPKSFAAHTTHRQSVLTPPPDAQVLARSTRDPLQFLRYGPQAVSTQFHPEFTAAGMHAYIAARTDALREEGLDPAALADAVHDTEAARTLLERFARTALHASNVAAFAESQAMDGRSGVPEATG